MPFGKFQKNSYTQEGYSTSYGFDVVFISPNKDKFWLQKYDKNANVIDEPYEINISQYNEMSKNLIKDPDEFSQKLFEGNSSCKTKKTNSLIEDLKIRHKLVDYSEEFYSSSSDDCVVFINKDKTIFWLQKLDINGLNIYLADDIYEIDSEDYEQIRRNHAENIINKQKYPIKNNNTNEKLKDAGGCLVFLLFLGFIFSLPFSIPFVADGLSSQERLERRYLIKEYEGLKKYDEITESILVEYLHENSKDEIRTGAICNDGWVSYSTGHGTCSHHGGVSTWTYKTVYSKSYEDCRIEAEDLIRKCRNKAFEVSWID
jgi:hypothetical protein